MNINIVARFLLNFELEYLEVSWAVNGPLFRGPV